MDLSQCVPFIECTKDQIKSVRTEKCFNNEK